VALASALALVPQLVEVAAAAVPQLVEVAAVPQLELVQVLPSLELAVSPSELVWVPQSVMPLRSARDCSIQLVMEVAC
jgi:hypothetical protein